MSFCSQCGCEIELRFCRRCGAPNVWSGGVEVADSPNRVRIPPAYPSLSLVNQFMIDALESLSQAMANQIASILAAQMAVVEWEAVNLPVQIESQTQNVPIDIQPGPASGGNVTPAELQAIIDQLQDTLDSDNEISEMTSMQLQMLMDAGSKLLELVSHIEDYKRRLAAHQLD